MADFVLAMAGGADPGEVRAGAAGGEAGCAEVQTVGADAVGEVGIVIDEHQRAMTTRQLADRFGKPQALCRRQRLVANLDQAQTAGQCGLEAFQLTLDAFNFGHGDGHLRWQRQCFENRVVGGQDRMDRCRFAGVLPVHRSMFERCGDADFS